MGVCIFAHGSKIKNHTVSNLRPSMKDKISHLLLLLLICISFFLFVCFVLFCFVFFAAASAYGRSQVRGQSGAAAAGLHHSNCRSESHLRTTPQLMAMPDP